MILSGLSERLRDQPSGPQGRGWTLTDVVDLARNGGDVRGHRSVERALHGEGVIPAALDTDRLRDECDRPLKAKVAAMLLDANRRKRQLSIFAQWHNDRAGNHVLTLNDGRGHLRWAYAAASIAGRELADLFLLLLGEEADRAVIWPHARLCRALREGADSDEQFFGLRTALAAYSPVFDLASFAACLPAPRAPRSELTHLDRLEAESMHILREVAATADRPVMLYSVGKDSAVMLHLARKAFHPSPAPFPLMHVDTGWKFQEMYQFRDQMARNLDIELIVHTNQEGLTRGINPFDHGSTLHTDIMKTAALKQGLDQYKFDVAFGGARRDEEKSRAKERIFSFRTAQHRWDPKNQRPELWNLYNTHKNSGESIRVFPISNWTELDIWQYIYREQIPIVPLYFARQRPVVVRNGFIMMADDDRIRLADGEALEMRKVRFRTLGCYPLTGAVESEADDLASIILELLQARSSERQGRAIDKDQTASMEKKKQEGYF